jgi:diguanylate cyclase (GGDEF)-like protein
MSAERKTHVNAILDGTRAAERELIGVARRRRVRRPTRREVATAILTSGSFLAAATAFAVFGDTARPFDGLTAVALVAAFAVLSRCEFEIGARSAVPTQLAVVPMLFLAPLPLVPLLVCAGYLLGGVYDAAAGRAPIARSIALPGCSWFCLPPALILFAAGETGPAWSAWPVLALAFGAQCVADFAHSTVQQRLAYGVSPRSLVAPLARIYAIDLLLTPVALLAARDGSLSFLALAPLLLVFAALVHERSGRFDALLEAARAEHLALTDPLTGLANRRAFEQELAAAPTADAPLTICMFDLDRFKRYNDTHGHPAGDELLRELADAWRGLVRPGDVLARFGGEEFALLLPGCTLAAARPIVERLRAATPRRQTCSAGLATAAPNEDPSSLVQRADEALYRAKRAGRARLELSLGPAVFSPPAPRAKPEQLALGFK